MADADGSTSPATFRQRLVEILPTGTSTTSEPVQMAEPTPILISHRVRAVLVIALFVIFGFLVRSVPSIFGTVLFGATLALILSFPVRVLQRYLSRKASIAVVTVGLIGGTVLILALLVPFLINEITQFISAVPSAMNALMGYVTDVLNQFYERGWINRQPDSYIDDAQEGLLDSAQTIITTGLTSTVSTLSASVSLLITAFGAVFVAVYLLADIPKFRDSYLRMWAPGYRLDAQVLWDTLGYSLSRYLGALVVSLLIQGLFIFLGLQVLGVPYALVLGIVQAITAILPYIGAFIAFIPAFLVALTVSWQTAVGVAILYLLLNQLEGNLITPRLQGSAVKVHPILIFIGVIGGGQLFGFVGAMLAVPTIGILRVVFEFFWLRIRVAEDRPTLLAMMRRDTASERMENRDVERSASSAEILAAQAAPPADE